jgi:hypothetical protein
MNLTISADEDVIRGAREAARAEGKSLNELLREYMTQLAAKKAGEAAAREWMQLVERGGGHGNGYTFRRDDVYTGRRFDGP